MAAKISSSTDSTKNRFHEIETSQFAYRRKSRTVSALKRCQPVAGSRVGGAGGEGSAGDGEVVMAGGGSWGSRGHCRGGAPPAATALRQAASPRGQGAALPDGCRRCRPAPGAEAG